MGTASTKHWHVIAYPGGLVITPTGVSVKAADRIAHNYSRAHPEMQVHGKPCDGNCPR